MGTLPHEVTGRFFIPHITCHTFFIVNIHWTLTCNARRKTQFKLHHLMSTLTILKAQCHWNNDDVWWFQVRGIHPYDMMSSYWAVWTLAVLASILTASQVNNTIACKQIHVYPHRLETHGIQHESCNCLGSQIQSEPSSVRESAVAHDDTCLQPIRGGLSRPQLFTGGRGRRVGLQFVSVFKETLSSQQHSSHPKTHKHKQPYVST